jgi:iron complex outermembrane receptor protein
MSRMFRAAVSIHLAAAMSTATAWGAAAEGGAEGPALAEVVVTAQKREQNVNDVGIAITAFDSAAIKSLGFSQPADLGNSVTNLSVSTLNTNVPNFSIRGVGVNDYAINQATSVGIYVDGVFLASPAMLNFQMFDTQRIEVLKGPQGTLFGRNTTGGAVQFISNTPTDTFDAFTYDEAGTYGYYEVEGGVSGPLTDTLSARVSFNTTQSDGYQKSLITGRTNGGLDRTAARIMSDWKPLEDLKIRFNIHAGKDKSNLLTYTRPGIGNNVESQGTIDTTTGVPYRDNDGKGASIIADWNLGPVALTSVSSYEQLHRFEYQDQDGRPGSYIDAILRSYLRQASEELRLASTGSGPLIWVAGLYYGKDEINDRTDYALPLAGFTPGGFGIDSSYPVLNTLGNTYFQVTRSRAAFGQLEWNPTDRLHLTGGLRYTKESKELFDVTTPYTIDPGPGQTGPVESGVLFPAAAYSRDFSSTSGKVGVDYHLSSDALLYASASKGFKSGGFPGTLIFSADSLHFFDPETVVDYEGGSKLKLAGGRVQLNTALFYYNYKNLQAQGTIVGGAGGITNLFALQNIGDARNFGGEIEVQAAPTEKLTLSAGIGYLDAAITKPHVEEVRPGGRPALSPLWNANGRAHYVLYEGSKVRWFTDGDFTFKGSQFFDIYQTPYMREGAYWLFNADFGVETADHKWRATVWGRNLADREYRVGAFTGGVAGDISMFGAPRTAGLSFSYHY